MVRGVDAPPDPGKRIRYRRQRAALEPAAIGRMIAVVEHELGHGLYEAVGKLKRALSAEGHAAFHFESADFSINVEVARADFERWIAADLARIADTVDGALATARLTPGDIDHVFLTGGSSLIPAVRRLFAERFRESRLAGGEELTSIAHGLALIGGAPDIADWIAPEESGA